MSLASKVLGAFDKAARTAGAELHARGQVRIGVTTPTSLEARVKDSVPCYTTLVLGPSRLIVDCTCPQSLNENVRCGHLWATVLAADAHGQLAGAPDRSSLAVVSEEDVVDEWDEKAAPTEADADADLEGPVGFDASDDGAVEDEDNDDDDDAAPPELELPARGRPPAEAPPRGWRKKLEFLRASWESRDPRSRSSLEPGSELLYLLVPDEPSQPVRIELAYRYRKQNGGWSKFRVPTIPEESVAFLPDPADRRILSLLLGGRERAATYQMFPTYPSYSTYQSTPEWARARPVARFDLQPLLMRQAVPEMARTGRMWLKPESPKPGSPKTEPLQLVWDEGPAFELWVEMRADGAKGRYRLHGSLRRGEERLALEEVAWIGRGGILLRGNRLALLEDDRSLPWIALLQDRRGFEVTPPQATRLLAELFRLPHVPHLELPDELAVREERVPLTLGVRIEARPGGTLDIVLTFFYGDVPVAEGEPGSQVFDAPQRRVLLRDLAAERAAGDQLSALGVRAPASDPDRVGPVVRGFAPQRLPRLVPKLVALGWRVEAEGRLFRRPGGFKLEVTSAVDWFDLDGKLDFDGQTASLPEILAALRRGESTVRLGDGTFGVLPEDWLRRYGLLAGLGEVEQDSVRFRRSQAALLDALLAERPEVVFDAEFAQAREELARFSGIAPVDAPPGFTGTLREYQREGLGWLAFLERSGFGGCLADDMGLGKTVQVLALLEGRRGRIHRPSLVVVPRSLLFNWTDEAAKFAPELRVLQHTGPERRTDAAVFAKFDVVLTTYGLLRRDVLSLKDIRFDYVVLDEAQSIKNDGSESAKAARLLDADHRLALSGTPIENHLGELWSLFEFLNPGMLGRASLFRQVGADGRGSEAEKRALLARGLRPFLLRRTKEQVATDLPGKTEQTIHCELEPDQRRIYEELREFYRRSLLARIDRDGLARTKMHVLEALLRLRQAAIHPGLIDPKRAGMGSAKLDFLIPHLTEVAERGHKALVFSQFTRMLAIVRNRLEAEKVTYEYLDGQTRDRADRVRRFQEDPECRLFLVSLKAGGLGLNLTAADYVFILDPWWNPAAEAQAVDRAHRIGQDKHVFAYRLIARDTIEEKVVELQRTKRELAAAILTEDMSLVRGLTREDLELLLS